MGSLCSLYDAVVSLPEGDGDDLSELLVTSFDEMHLKVAEGGCCKYGEQESDMRLVIGNYGMLRA